MSGRVTLLLVSTALILVILLGWFVLVSPQHSKASKLGAQVDQTNVQLAAVTSLLNGPVGRQSFAALRTSEIAMPDGAKMSQILRQLSGAAAASGVELDSVAPQALVPVSGAQALPLGLTVQGHYFAIQHFLRILRSKAKLQGDKVHATGRLYTIDGIQFTGGGTAPTTGQAGGSTGLVSAALTANAFVYQPTAVAAPTTPATTTGDATSTTVPPAAP
jgi:hypothetical protein